MQWRSLAEWAGFQLVWLTCAIGAARGMTVPGVLAAMVFILGVLAMKRWSRTECLAILISGVAGLAVDSAFAQAGLVRFAAPWPSSDFAPVWLIALWLAFGATLSGMVALFGKHLAIKAGLVAAIAGPLAYFAGERLGALAIVEPRSFSYVSIALVWAVVLPALLLLQQWILSRSG